MWWALPGDWIPGHSDSHQRLRIRDRGKPPVRPNFQTAQPGTKIDDYLTRFEITFCGSLDQSWLEEGPVIFIPGRLDRHLRMGDREKPFVSPVRQNKQGL
jgi:hypothetical protein